MATPTKKRGRNKTSFANTIPLILILLLSPSFYIGYWFYTPHNPNGQNEFVEIKKGGNINTISSLLKERGIINNSLYYRIIGRIVSSGLKPKAGEYLLSASMSPSVIMGKISGGKVYMHQVTIPEGFNIYEIASLLEGRQLVNRERFLATVTDREFIKSLSFDLPSLEGYLFPTTYLLARGMTEREIAAKMVNTFKELADSEIAAKAAAVGLTPHQVVNMASLVEKETALNEEKSIITSVFHNRLKKGMRLQCDPTVIYAIKNFDGNIKKKDLTIDSPYNTYRYAGLPIGPIANPGIESIRGVLNPMKSDYLYFVATKKGGHYFSTNIKDHNRAVREYQLNGG